MLLVLAVIVSLSTGSIRIPVREVANILLDRTQNIPHAWILIIRNLRLPRILAACMVGGFLSVGGAVCQGLFRNPLSEPYLLGISSGAALGAAIAIVSGWTAIAPFAFAGAMAVSILVFIAAGRGAFRLPSTLLLSGLAIAFVCQAIIWLIMSFYRDKVEQITFWTLGSLSAVTWSKVSFLALITLPLSAVCMIFGRILDMLSMGYESAHSLGLNPQRNAGFLLILTALGTAAAVAVAGSIGFVGLMAPHAMRIIGGPAHRNLILRSWLAGALLLLIADTVARTLYAPGEIPIGIITAIFGAPFLLILIHTRQREGRLDG